MENFANKNTSSTKENQEVNNNLTALDIQVTKRVETIKNILLPVK